MIRRYSARLQPHWPSMTACPVHPNSHFPAASRLLPFHLRHRAKRPDRRIHHPARQKSKLRIAFGPPVPGFLTVYFGQLSMRLLLGETTVMNQDQRPAGCVSLPLYALSISSGGRRAIPATRTTGRDLLAIPCLSRRERKSYGAFGIRGNHMNFDAPPTATLADGLRPVFNVPVPSRCTFTMVLSKLTASILMRINCSSCKGAPLTTVLCDIQNRIDDSHVLMQDVAALPR